MKKFSIFALVFALFAWSCSSSQQKECECPPVQQSQDDSKSQETASSSTATRSGEADTPETAKTEESKPAETAKTEETKPAETAKTEETKPVETQSGEASSASGSTSFPNPKTPIGQKPLNTASSILGGSGEQETAANTRRGSGEAESQTQHSQGSSRDQIRKIDRESDYVIPPQVVPLKRSNSQSNSQTPAPTGAGSSSSLGFQCEDYNEDTKSIICKGSSARFKGDTVLEFDARNFRKLFLGFDLTLKDGEIEVKVPGGVPTKATPSKPFIYLGEVTSENDKVKVIVKANPNEAKQIDYVVRLLYHGKG